MFELREKIDDEAIELERMENLLYVLAELFDEIPPEDSKDRAAGLECFCQRQGMVRAIQDSIFDVYLRIKHSNNELSQYAERLQKTQ